MEEKIEKKPGFFGKLQKSKKKQVLFFAVSMVVLVCIYLILTPLIYKKNISKLKIIDDDFSWVYQIDSIKNSDGKLWIDGWAFKLGKNAEEGAYEIILLEHETGNIYFPTLSYMTRDDVNQYFFCEYDYREIGFSATINIRKLDLEQCTYEVLLREKNQSNIYATGVYYAGNKMMFVNPREYEPLHVAGTDLDKIVKEGVIRVYQPDVGMYVYQYSGELYWIAEEEYGLTDENIYVQFQMDTTQIENLPEERLKNGWNWSNESFYFDVHELINWNTGKYRVAKSELPTEYSITKIWTGNYIDDWIWKKDFRPWYEFDNE